MFLCVHLFFGSLVTCGNSRHQLLAAGSAQPRFVMLSSVHCLTVSELYSFDQMTDFYRWQTKAKLSFKQFRNGFYGVVDPLL